MAKQKIYFYLGVQNLEAHFRCQFGLTSFDGVMFGMELHLARPPYWPSLADVSYYKLQYLMTSVKKENLD